MSVMILKCIPKQCELYSNCVLERVNALIWIDYEVYIGSYSHIHQEDYN